MDELKHVSSNPHIRSSMSTQKIMLIVICSLLPAACFGIWNFGVRALLLICVCIGTCVLTEFLM